MDNRCLCVSVTDKERSALLRHGQKFAAAKLQILANQVNPFNIESVAT
jgi:DNA-binding MarR family transcriptional regulator